MAVSLVKEYVYTFPYPYDDIWFKMSPAFKFLVDHEIIDLEKDADIPSRVQGLEEITFELDGPWSGSNYSGDDITESNQRSLVRDYPQLLIDSTRYTGWETYGLQIDPWFGWGEDAETAMELAEILVGLKYEYILYDEDDHYFLILERAQKAWDDVLYSDLAWEVEKLLGFHLDFTTDKAGEIFWECLRDHEIWPEAEGARDVIFRGIEDEEFLLDLARRVLEEQGPEFPEYVYDLTDEGYAVLGDYMAKEYEGQCPGQMTIL